MMKYEIYVHQATFNYIYIYVVLVRTCKKKVYSMNFNRSFMSKKQSKTINNNKLGQN